MRHFKTLFSIIDSNVKIAIFMNIVIKPILFGMLYGIYGETGKFLFFTHTHSQATKKVGTCMVFHNSWNWLMPVAKKIVEIKDESDQYKILTEQIKINLQDVDMTSLYDNILVFIDWYNEKE